MFTQEDFNKNKVMGILAYLGFLALIPFFAAKESPYAQFHAKQGLNLLILEVAWSIVVVIISIVLGFVPVVGWILATLISLLGSLCLLAFVVIGIINALKPEMKELPIIGKIKIFN